MGEVLDYDPAADKWTRAGQLSAPRSDHGMSLASSLRRLLTTVSDDVAQDCCVGIFNSAISKSSINTIHISFTTIVYCECKVYVALVIFEVLPYIFFYLSD